jgi:hypothetical protein
MITDHRDRIAREIAANGEECADLWGQKAYRFSATLLDGTHLSCVDSFHGENLLEDRTDEDGKPYRHFLPAVLGYAAYDRCLIHADHIASAGHSPFWAPSWIRNAFWKSELKDGFSMRITFSDGFECTLRTSGQSLYFELPDGREWSQVIATHEGYDMHPSCSITARLVFTAVVGGLPNAPEIKKENKPAHPTAGNILL